MVQLQGIRSIDGVPSICQGRLARLSIPAKGFGSGIRLMIEVADPMGSERWAKQLMECTTLTVSVHRVKDPARACGYIGAKGYSRGSRTVAGTLVLTQGMQDVLFEFLSAFALRDKSKDSTYTKVDQLPPFNITCIFSNEYGYASFRRLLGVEFVTDGTVYSINDAFSEQTISYVCADFTPLAPLSMKEMVAPVLQDLVLRGGDQNGPRAGESRRRRRPSQLRCAGLASRHGGRGRCAGALQHVLRGRRRRAPPRSVHRSAVADSRALRSEGVVDMRVVWREW